MIFPEMMPDKQDAIDRYESLSRPSWAPPSGVFSPVWSVLYVIIAVSYGYVGFLYAADRLPFIILFPFLLNLAFNFAFVPLMFGANNRLLASVDILLVVATLGWALAAVYPAAPWIVYANLPYLLWVLYATALQLSVLIMNL